jgi:hypothetical protein
MQLIPVELLIVDVLLAVSLAAWVAAWVYFVLTTWF